MIAVFSLSASAIWEEVSRPRTYMVLTTRPIRLFSPMPVSRTDRGGGGRSHISDLVSSGVIESVPARFR